MSYLTAGGIAHHVQELGAGPPVVMIHGLLLGSMASWYFTAAPALARRHRVRLYDLRGHGRSSIPATGYQLPSMAADLEALMSHLGMERVHLVGHSFGGRVALTSAPGDTTITVVLTSR